MTDAERLMLDPAALDVWLEERKALCDAATPPDPVSGWYAGGVEEIDGQPMWPVYRDDDDPNGSVETLAYCYAEKDCEFVADARTSLPTALEVIRRLREELIVAKEAARFLAAVGSDLKTKVAALQQRVAQVSKLYKLTLDNELRWMRKHNEAMERVAALEAERPKEWCIAWLDSSDITCRGSCFPYKPISNIPPGAWLEYRDAAGEWTRE